MASLSIDLRHLAPGDAARLDELLAAGAPDGRRLSWLCIAPDAAAGARGWLLSVAGASPALHTLAAGFAGDARGGWSLRIPLDAGRAADWRPAELHAADPARPPRTATLRAALGALGLDGRIELKRLGAGGWAARRPTC
ncbi:hypothetical protein [Derxia lacustris]|uniref:hypothetical protein n=1 Tax=Derxia lacustris TaxID=764842 RepID=UPI000A16E984|nr:hypothetical protein [Derxia lacustris]